MARLPAPAPAVIGQAIHRCRIDGRVTYTNQPCAGAPKTCPRRRWARSNGVVGLAGDACRQPCRRHQPEGASHSQRDAVCACLAAEIAADFEFQQAPATAVLDHLSTRLGGLRQHPCGRVRGRRRAGGAPAPRASGHHQRGTEARPLVLCSAGQASSPSSPISVTTRMGEETSTWGCRGVLPPQRRPGAEFVRVWAPACRPPLARRRAPPVSGAGGVRSAGGMRDRHRTRPEWSRAALALGRGAGGARRHGRCRCLRATDPRAPRACPARPPAGSRTGPWS